MTAKPVRSRVDLRTRRSGGIQFAPSANVRAATSQSRLCSASAGPLRFPPRSHEQLEGVWTHRGSR